MYTVPGHGRRVPITAKTNPADSHVLGNTGLEKSAPGIVLVDVRRIQVTGDPGKPVNVRIGNALENRSVSPTLSWSKVLPVILFSFLQFQNSLAVESTALQRADRTPSNESLTCIDVSGIS